MSGAGGVAGNGAAGEPGAGSGASVGAGGAGGKDGQSDCPSDHVFDDVTESCHPVLAELIPVAVAPSDASLLEPLAPALSNGEFRYRLETSFWLTEVRFDVAGPEDSSIEVDGKAPADATVSFGPGDNEVEISVETALGSSVYSVTVHRRMPIRLEGASAEHRFGTAVVASADVLAVGTPTGTGTEGRVHIYRRTSPGVWEEQAPPLSGDGSFGTSLSFDGTTLAVGAPDASSGGIDDAGLMYFFRSAGSGWESEQVAPTSSPEFARELGVHVALSGAAAAGTTDNVNELHTYSRDADGVWREDPGSYLEADDNIAFIEGMVAIDDNWLILGAHNGNLGPTAFVYTRAALGQAWAKPASGDAVLQASGMFADSVAIRGRTLVVNGEPVRVFQRANDNTWDDSPLPVDSLGPLALTQTTLVIGAEQDEFNAPEGSDVWVFRRADTTSAWKEDPNSPLPTSVTEAESFGSAVATSSSRVFVGAPTEDPGGAVYVYD